MSHPTEPQIVTTRAELRAALAAARSAGKTIGLVPTMGALHAGHVSLAAASTAECGFTVVTIFVNPTQFAPSEDLQAYPRDLSADVAALAPLGVDLVFAPSVEEMYSGDSGTLVQVGAIAETLEGASRPDHFPGVATVVLKLFQLIPADVAYFGQKDYQQTLVVKTMVRDLNVPITIRVCPTVREPDGLAMSSRNVYLSSADRQKALTISRSLQLAESLVAAGERNAQTIADKMHTMLKEAGITDINYAIVVDANTLAPLEQIEGPVVAAIAATLGNTRLIDNAIIEVP